MESGGTNIESVPGKPLSDCQDTGATIPLMVDCAGSNNHDAAKESVKKKNLLIDGHGAGNTAMYEAVLNVGMEMKEFGKTHLHKAAEDKNFELIKSLLEHPKNLVDAQDEFGYTALHRSTQQAKPDKEIISLLINHRADIGMKNEFGDTPLHLATEQANPDKEIIRHLIRHGADIGVKNKCGEIPQLSTADYQELFNGGISVVTAERNDGKFLQLNFGIFKPRGRSKEEMSNDQKPTECSDLEQDRKVPHEESSPQSETETILNVINHSEESRQLLKNPLVEAFLTLKWNKIWWLYLLWIFFKVAFFINFSTLILLEYRPMEPKDNECQNQCFPCRILLKIFIIVLIFAEIVQLLALQFGYFIRPSNYLQIFILTISSILVLKSDSDSCSNRKHLAGLVLPLVCLETLQEVLCHPKWAHVVQMLFKVTTTFLFYLVWYAFLVVSFGISLFIIFGNSNNISETDYNYSDFRKVILKVFAMFTGEIDLNGIPLSLDNDFNYAAEFLFLMFFLLITVVVLMNLLNGLAVSDTNEILAASNLIGIQSVLEVIAFWESFLLGDPDGRCPNIRCPFGRKIWRKCFQLLWSGKTKYCFNTKEAPPPYWKKWFSRTAGKFYVRSILQSSDDMSDGVRYDADVWKRGLVRRGIGRGQNISKEIFSSASNCINGNESDGNFATLEEKFGEMDGKIGKMNGKISKMDGKIDGLDEKIGGMEQKITVLDDKMNEILLAIREIVPGFT